MSNVLWFAAIALLVVWLLGWLVFEVASGLIHLILIIVAVLIVINILKRVRTRV